MLTPTIFKNDLMTAVMYWLCERRRDLWLWPLNLVRDFPARSGRLAQTVLQGGGGVGNALGQFSQAVHQRNVRATAARTAQETVIWLHLLTAQLFDLLGGPELCQFVMHLGMRTTPLTQPEIDLARQIFGANNLRYNDIRIAEGGILNLIFRYNGRLAFATWYTIHLPASQQKGETAVSSRHNLPLLIHELTHIFQYHHVGSRYLGKAIFHLITTQRD